MSAYFGAYGVTVSLGGKKALDQVSFELERGSFTALLGPNGSGKSTLLRACAGIQEADEGVFRYQEIELRPGDPRSWSRMIAYLAPELVAEFPLTALETVLLGRTVGATSQGLLTLTTGRDLELARQAMERCCCWELRDRELQTLSGGERQLVSLAKALVREPRVLLLDETLSRMDLNHQARIGDVLAELAKDEGVAVMLVAHDVNLATHWAKHCILIERGRAIAHGPVSQVWTTENVTRLYPGASLEVGVSGQIHF
jgi:iron complex transport system ATP-binding protein